MKSTRVPDRPEDALLDLLRDMRIPQAAWEPYLSQHLAAPPGWVGFIKWRAHQSLHPWQEAYPTDLVKYRAVRLFYERELVESPCRTDLAHAGTDDTLQQYMHEFPAAYRLRRTWVAGQVPTEVVHEVRRLARSSRQHNHAAWEAIGRRADEHRRALDSDRRLHTAARHLVRVARALTLDAAAIEAAAPSDLHTLLAWLDSLPASQQGTIWLQAFETTHRRQVLRMLSAGLSAGETERPARRWRRGR